jgi:hypothetical protein
MAKKILNLDLEVLGKLNLSTVPNTAGDILTFDGLNQVSKRTVSQIISDIGAASVFHNHVEADITDLQSYLLDAPSNGSEYVRLNGAWAVASGGGGGGSVWGGITGTLASQSDLQTALDGKVDLAGDTMTSRLTVTGNGIPIITEGAGVITNTTALNYYLAKDSIGANMWYMGVASTANNDVVINNYNGNAFIRLKDGGEESGLEYYTGAATRTVWHSGNLITTDFVATTGDTMTGELNITRTGDGVSLLRFNTERAWEFRQGSTGAGTTLDLIDTAGAKTFHIGDTTKRDRIRFSSISGNIATDGDLEFSSGAITRTVFNGGYLEGGHNNIGSTATRSNPIYVIGSAYVPTASTLNNMYGIGYAEGNTAAFLNATDLGTNPSGWGMYVASDGNARLFFNAGSGTSYQLGVSYASNFTLNSDRRRKTKIKDYKVVNDKIRWRTFELKTEPGQYRVGVIAQELLKTKYSKFVNEEDPTNYTVNNIDLLNAAMAEKDYEIAELRKENKELRNDVDLIMKKLGL